ncbi:hypothetical protein B484DRAFT_454754 [Ochromonadaceae sp. CCMP2298]|nr:hypothetical protein B484DRAFT_454754 [Ochromonadaceae sp. CCMP2298]
MKGKSQTRTPKLVGAKGGTSQPGKAGTVTSFDIPAGAKHSEGTHESHQHPPAESDLMGGGGLEGNKSEVMDKNLLQMFDVLRKRLDTLKEAAKTRSKLCEEDTNKNSDKMSEQAPKIIDEFDEVVPRSLRDIKMPTLSHKDNLVSSDTIYIDPYHLVFSKTKVPTEAAKNLESSLEESFGNINMREMKSKKSKTLNQTEKSKKSEQLKNEAKRINRMKIEKKLQQNMESFVTRSVMDGELRFDAPSMADMDADWPVTIKWSAKDPRSALPENHEGEFDPDLLLRYSIERINLPTGKKLFNFLVRQPMIQRYFVSLFWLLKVKFFESDGVEESECYLLRLLSMDYRRIVELMASRAHAEHEKDFAFRYLPFVLANGVFFGFYYVFPGSRHIYTKGFKKTIYMQIVQIMHGIQMCPSSVKVAWSKLFPEDTHEDGDEVEDGGESFPVLIALKGSSRMLAPTLEHDDDTRSTASASPPLEQLESRELSPVPFPEDAPVPDDSRFQRPNLARGHVKGGFLSDQAPSYGGADSYSHGHGVGHANYGTNLTAAYGVLSKTQTLTHTNSASAQALTSSSLKSALQRRSSSANIGRSVDLTAKSLAAMALNSNKTPVRMKGYQSTRGPSSALSFNTTADRDRDTTQPPMGTMQILVGNETMQSTLSRTYLKPLREKPSQQNRLVVRQNVHELLNAHEQSPQMQLYLSDAAGAKPPTHTHLQVFQRTIPISWCASGGSDTHRKITVSTELHAEISTKLRKSESELSQSKMEYHKEKIRSVVDTKLALGKVLTSGPTSISRFSLDLIRRQRSKGGPVGKEIIVPVVDEVVTVDNTQQQLLFYSDEELEKILNDLS